MKRMYETVNKEIVLDGNTVPVSMNYDALSNVFALWVKTEKYLYEIYLTASGKLNFAERRLVEGQNWMHIYKISKEPFLVKLDKAVREDATVKDVIAQLKVIVLQAVNDDLRADIESNRKLIDELSNPVTEA